MRYTYNYKLVRHTNAKALRIALAILLPMMSLGGALPLIISHAVQADPAPTIVYVDPNYTLASDNGHTFGTDAFTTIQAGVDAVASGGTVEVDAGTYKEAVTINQALTLDGAMVGQDARGRSGDESIITAVGTSPNITVNASNVTIDGLTLDGPAGSSAAISMMGGATDSNEVVQNNIINDASRAVVFDTSNTTFNQNVVNQVDAADYIDGFEENTLAANSVSFTANDFNDGNNGGNSNADISFIGDPNDLSTGLVVQGNESLNGATLLAVTNTESASVTNNTATNDNQSAFFIGGNDLDITLPSNSITGDTAGGAILIANYFGYGPNSIASSFYNHFMNDSFGVDVDSSAGPALFTTATADFRNSWWGAANGPSDSNATDDSLPASNAGSGMPVIGAVNYGPWCATEDCTVDSDTPLAAPTGLTPTNDTYTNNSSYSNTWTPVAGAASYQYQSSETLKNSTQLGILYASDDSSASNYTVSSSLVTRTNSHVPDATYYWQVRSVNEAGTPSPWSPITEVTVDTTAPTIKTNIKNAQVVSGTTKVTEKVTDVNPSGYAITILNAKGTAPVLVNGAPILAYEQPVTNKMLVLKWDTTQVPNGKYTVQLSAIDKANNIATIYRKVTVTNKITTPTAVVATITSPTNNATVNGNVTVSGTVVDTNPDFYDLVIRDAGGNVVGGPSVIYAPTVADYDWDTTQLANGVYTIDLVGQDQAGDKGVATEQVTVDNNAVVPSNPIVTPPANANTPQTSTNPIVKLISENTPVSSNTGDNLAPTGNILAENTTKGNLSGEVKGDATDEASDDANLKSSKLSSFEWGVAILLAIAGLAFFIADRRKSNKV